MAGSFSSSSLMDFENTPDASEESVFVFPVSFAQQRLWFLDRLEPGNPFYNIPTAVRLTGALNATALEQTLNEIVRRHEALRTTFATMDGRPVQVINPVLTLTLPVMDLRELPEAEREVKARRLAAEETQRPFDLARGPLVRATLLQLGEKEYILLLTTHHIVSDGWSMGILIREVTTIYEAFSNGKPSPLSELPIQYADFAYWQREWLQGKVLEDQLSYWKQQLGGSLPVLTLPTDRPRPPVQTYQGAHHSFVLPKPLTEALKALGQQEGATLFMTLLTAFKILLYRYTGQEEVVVGSPVANRNRPEIEGLIGFFVNMLVLRTELSGNPTFRELLGRVREVALGAYAHQDLPFEKLVEELQPERDLSRSPLFQVMFALQNALMPALKLPGLTLTPLEIESGTTIFDQSLFMTDTEQGLMGLFEYNTDLFDAATIARMARHFQTLLESILANPEQRLSELTLLTEAEHHQLLVEWNDTQTEYPEDSCVHELFEAQVERTPNAVAVIFGEEQLTYRELNRRANQLAHYLRALGVGPEVLVGICMERSLEMVVGLLSILKAGGAYVPLDPAYPKERLTLMLEDAQVEVLLTQEQLLEVLPEHGAESVCLDADWEIVSQESQENLIGGATTDNLAYVIYTSGSTGKPKGVQIPHRALTNFLSSMRQRPGLTDRDTLLAVTTLSFDIAGLELYLPITTGARLVLVSREVTSDGGQLSGRIDDSNATVMQATPATWRLLLESGWQGSKQLTVLCGGEVLPRELANQLLEKGASLWNLYGPAETTIWSTLHQVDSQEGAVSIGRPIANTQVYLLDDNLRPAPIGVPGELHIGGAGLARGYLNRPELTAEKFIPSPFNEEPGVRLYKTGDLACYRPDGNIEFLGRIDHQVKVRGFRIEPGEIEALLGQHPGVGKTVVVAREDHPGDPSSQLRTGKRLVAYFVPAQEPAPTTSELRRFLQEKLPHYMVPSVFMVLDALPLTPNMKVDRRALPAPEGARPELEAAYVAPRTPTEETLAEIFVQILDLEKVGVYDNFFDLGGHSLLATQVISRISSKLQLELPLQILFEAPTVATLAEHIETIRWAAQGPQAVPGAAADDREQVRL